MGLGADHSTVLPSLPPLSFKISHVVLRQYSDWSEIELLFNKGCRNSLTFFQMFVCSRWYIDSSFLFQSVMESLSILRKVVFESDLMGTSAGRPISQAGIMSKDFKRLGFMVSFSRELCEVT